MSSITLPRYSLVCASIDHDYVEAQYISKQGNGNILFVNDLTKLLQHGVKKNLDEAKRFNALGESDSAAYHNIRASVFEDMLAELQA